MVKAQAQAWRLEPSLPGTFYTGEAHFAGERERIFFREWLCAGREEALPEPGDYLELSILGESILVVHTQAGLSAFYNVCRHRGCQLTLGAPAAETATGTPHWGVGSLQGAYPLPLPLVDLSS